MTVGAPRRFLPMLLHLAGVFQMIEPEIGAGYTRLRPLHGLLYFAVVTRRARRRIGPQRLTGLGSARMTDGTGGEQS